MNADILYNIIVAWRLVNLGRIHATQKKKTTPVVYVLKATLRHLNTILMNFVQVRFEFKEFALKNAKRTNMENHSPMIRCSQIKRRTLSSSYFIWKQRTIDSCGKIKKRVRKKTGQSGFQDLGRKIKSKIFSSTAPNQMDGEDDLCIENSTFWRSTENYEKG